MSLKIKHAFQLTFALAPGPHAMILNDNKKKFRLVSRIECNSIQPTYSSPQDFALRFFWNDDTTGSLCERLSSLDEHAIEQWDEFLDCVCLSMVARDN